MNDDKDDTTEEGGDEDAALWDRYTADIDKYGPSNRTSNRTKPGDERDIDSDSASSSCKSAQHQRGQGQNKPRHYNETLSGYEGRLKPAAIHGGAMGTAAGAAQMDKRTHMRLKRGQMPIDARIDLHGLYQHDAKAQLLAFIQRSHRAGCRCVLVITGKGQLVFEGETPAERTPGVIKRSLKSWLAADPYASMILAVETAHMKHGGEGAYYVLLRRSR